MMSEQHKQIVISNYNAPKSRAEFKKQLQIFKTWKPQRDVLPLRYGSIALGLAGSVTGFYINVRFRRKLKLLSFGLLQSYAATMIAPAALIHLVYQPLVLQSIVLKGYHCPMCVQTRAVATQVGFGILYPLIISPVICLAIAGNNGYKVPHIHEVGELARFFSLVCKPMLPKLSVFAVCHTFLASYITYTQYVAMDKVRLIQTDTYYTKHSDNLE